MKVRDNIVIYEQHEKDEAVRRAKHLAWVLASGVRSYLSRL